MKTPTGNLERLRIPIADHLLAVFGKAHEGSRFDAADRAEHRPRLGDVAEAEVFGDGDVVEVAADVGMAQDALQLGGEENLLADARVEQRLLARAVARQEQRVRAMVPDRQAEHSVELRDRIAAALEIQRQNRFDIRLRSERIVAIARADLRGVVDLAVALEPDLRVRRGEGLVGALVQIDDAQPLGADDGIRMREHRSAVRPAMAQRFAHPLENFRIAERRAALGDHSVNAAHQRGIVYATKCASADASCAPCCSTMARLRRSFARTIRIRGRLRSKACGSHDAGRIVERGSAAKPL